MMIRKTEALTFQRRSSKTTNSGNQRVKFQLMIRKLNPHISEKLMGSSPPPPPPPPKT
jgi:hypothetical protein